MGEKRRLSATTSPASSTSKHRSAHSENMSRDDTETDHGESRAVKPNQGRISPLMPMFEWFRTELDEHHNQRERVIKTSRDITAASKKIIFALQRVRTLGQPVPEAIAKATAPYKETIKTLFRNIRPELQSVNAHRYASQISPGIQEHIEALLFEHYLQTQRLLSYEDTSAHYASEFSPQPHEHTDSTGTGPIIVSPEDYVLGLFDMTGEVMRFAITSIATNGVLPSSGPSEEAGSAPESSGQAGRGAASRTVLSDLQELRRQLSILNINLAATASEARFVKDVASKMEVMLASVDKVERAMYGLVVRGSERPKGWLAPDSQQDPRVPPASSRRELDMDLYA